jgi:D-inositol-3-phosphate glycosyltransferase
MIPRMERPSTTRQRRLNRSLATPNAEGSPLEGFIEFPKDGDAVGRLTELSGWHAWEGEPVAAVSIEVDGLVVGGAQMAGTPRADVAAQQGDARYARTGWVAAVDLRAVHTPTVSLCATVYPGVEHPGVRLEPLTVAVLGSPTLYESGEPIPPPDEVRGRLDVPSAGTVLPLGPVLVRGWARATSSTIAHVELSANGVALGRARLCGDRADVAAADAGVGATLSGFDQVVDLGVLAATTTSVTLVATPVALDGTRTELAVAIGTTAPALRLVPRVTASATASKGGLSLLVVTHDLGIGGAQLWLVEALRRIGAGRAFPCTVVAFGSGPLAAQLVALGIEVHVSAPLPVHDAAAYEGRLAELWAWLAPRSHTVALVNTFRAFPGADLAERHGLPVVWAVHESWPEPLIWAFDHPGVTVDPSVRAVAASALAGAGAVLFESTATLALYDDRAPGRTVYVPSGVDTAALDRVGASTSRSAARRALGLRQEGRIVLSVGTIEPRKGQTLLATAFAQVAERHDDVTLAIVGDLTTPYSAALHEFVRRAGLTERVLVAPVIPDVTDWYCAADVLVCSSDVESLPRSVLDAMCVGLPVVATRIFGLQELLTDGVTGVLFEPNDLRSAIDALDRVLSMDRRTLAAIAQRGRAVVHERHDASGYAADVLTLLRGLQVDPDASPADLLAAARARLDAPASRASR